MHARSFRTQSHMIHTFPSPVPIKSNIYAIVYFCRIQVADLSRTCTNEIHE